MDVLHEGQPLPPDAVMAVTGATLRDVMAERVRQIGVEGFTFAHDAGHHPGELGLAAKCYLDTAIDQLFGRTHPAGEVPIEWPWQDAYWKPGDARANLVKAGALLLACGDRIDHAPRDSGDLMQGALYRCLVCRSPFRWRGQGNRPFCTPECEASHGERTG